MDAPGDGARRLVAALLALFDDLASQPGYLVQKDGDNVELYARLHRVIGLKLEETVEESWLVVWMDDLRETTGLSFGAIMWKLTAQPGFGWLRTRAPRAANAALTVKDVVAEEPDPQRVCEGLRLWLRELIELRL